MSTLLGGLLGAILAGGVLVVVAGLRPPPPKSTRPSAPVDQALLTRLAPWLLVQMALTIFVWFVSGWPVLGVGVGALAWVGYMWVQANRARQHYHQVTEAISIWVDMVKDSLAGGAGLSQAIETTVPVAPEAIRPAVTRLAARQRTGSQSHALREFGATLAHPTADLVVLSLISATENQARDLPKLLAKTAEQARSRNETTMQIETERSRLYTEARAMVLAVAILGVIITLLAGDFLEPYDRFAGQVVLGIVMVMFVGSAATLVQAGRPQPDRRLLAAEGWDE